MTNTHSDARQTDEVRTVVAKKAGRPAATEGCQEDMGSELRGKLGPDILFNPLEDPRLGELVFFGPVPHSHPASSTRPPSRSLHLSCAFSSN